MTSGIAIRVFAEGQLANTPAGRLDEVMFWLAPPEYDDDGNYLGVGEPLISAEEARELLGSPEAVR